MNEHPRAKIVLSHVTKSDAHSEQGGVECAPRPIQGGADKPSQEKEHGLADSSTIEDWPHAAGGLSNQELNLLAKRSVPRHGYLLQRQRLRRLVEKTPTGIISVVAGPGYGKTAFLAAVLNSGHGSAHSERAYLAFGEEDEDPLRFFRLLFDTLDAILPGAAAMGRERIAGCLDPSNEAESVMRVLLRHLGPLAHRPMMLALDDIHLVESSPPVSAAIRLLLEEAPPEWLIFVASRHKMPFPLAPHRLSGRLCEVGLRRLRLTPFEVRCWARDRWSIELSLSEARSLWRTTEGWPVALVLMSELMHQSPSLRLKEDVLRLLGKGEHLNRYLSHQVFDSLQPLAREVVLAAFPLPRVVFPRDSDYLPGGQGVAERVMQEFVDRGFLVTQAGHRSYNIHPLVRGFAERELTLTQPDAARHHNLRAAGHLERAGELVPALSLYLRSGEGRAAGWILRALECANFDSSLLYYPSDWHALVVANDPAENPWLGVITGREMHRRGEYASSAHEFRQLAAVFQKGEDRLAEFKCLLNAAFSLYCAGNVRQALDLARKAERLASTRAERSEVLVVAGNLLADVCEWDSCAESLEQAIINGDPERIRETEARVFRARSKLFWYRGRFKTALDWAERALSAASGGARFTYAANLNQASVVCLNLGEYQRALTLALQALRICRDSCLVFLTSNVLINLGESYLALNQPREGIAALREASQTSQAAGHASNEVWVTDLFADVARRAGNPSRALALRTQATSQLHPDDSFALDALRLRVNCGIDLATLAREEEAADVLEAALHTASQLQLQALAGQAQFYLGWLAARRGDESRSVRLLKECLDQAEANGHIHFLLQEARCATPILALCHRHGMREFLRTAILPRMSERLQKYFLTLADGAHYPTDVPLGPPAASRRQLAVLASRSGKGVSDLDAKIALLTEREKDILILLAGGLPNKRIASQLYITEKTIKTHTNKIFRKLQVTSRVQAALLYTEYKRTRALS
jgi:ATP/maltotriose-dependent transcriptional regulator MalT